MDENLYWKKLNFGKLAVGAIVFDLGLSAVCYPFWLVKVRQQASTSGKAQSLKAFRNEVHAVWKLGGLPSLYRGISQSILLYFVPSFVYFSLYEGAKCYTHENVSPLLAPMVGATCAEGSFILTATPIENIQVKVFTQDVVEMKYYGFAKQIYQNEGFNGFYKGLTASSLTYLPAGWIWWSIYESLKRRAQFYFPSHELQGCLASALIASSVSTFALTPFDVAKTRLMNNAHGLYEAQSVLTLLRRIRQSEGFFALFRGIYPRLGLSAIEGLTGSMGYEFVVRYASNEIVYGSKD